MENNQQYSPFQNCLHKVYTALKVFLENVTYIYESSGIEFDALKNEKIFIRLLLPEENFRGVDWWGVQQQKEIKKMKIEETTLPYQNSYHNKSNTTWSQVDRPSESLYQTFSNSERTMKARPGIDHQMEEKVYYWAMEQFEKGTKVQMVELRKAAINWAKNKDFQGSTGWCSNFLNRYVDLKELVKNKDRKKNSIKRVSETNINKLSGRFRPDEGTLSNWNQEANNCVFNSESEDVESPLNSLSDSELDNVSIVEDDDENDEKCNKKSDKNKQELSLK